MEKPAAACYHLPGLFEFYELYRRFSAAVPGAPGIFLRLVRHRLYLRRTGGLHLGRRTHLLRRGSCARGAGADCGNTASPAG